MNTVLEKSVWNATMAFTMLVMVTLAMFSPGGVNNPIQSGKISPVSLSVDCNGEALVTPFSDLAKGSIEHNRGPLSAQPAYLILLTPILKSDNNNNHLKKQILSHKGTTILPLYRNQQHVVLTATPLISSNLGRRVTLVGAKPSGTS